MIILLVAFPLALLAIFAGMKLLAQTQKENLGNLFKYVSWFIVIMGFLTILCIGAHCVLHACHHGDRCMAGRECRMMDDDGCGPMGGCYGMGHMGGCNNMMGCPQMMGGCCGGMMMHGGCCNMEGNCHEGMGGSCHEGMGSCHEGSECHDGMSAGSCKDEGEGEESCPMMKGMKGGHCNMGKDSMKKK